MTFTEILLLAVGLSADAFSVAVCKGLSTKKFSPKMSVIVGLWFGFFQALMPAIGYFLGSAFVRYIEKFDHWIAFVLLAMIGVNMIRESFSKDEDDADSSLSFSSMLPLAVATSIDALAVGVAPLATLGIGLNKVLLCIALIGVTTFLLSAVGVKIGNKFGSKYKSKAEFIGGLVLIALGAKILIEHLFF
ncbi:MAG: manganese efflux pump [Clostridia bacterium]|nr:manganese efflux pump [Clostridia bacterium]